ncbi:MAG: efflux RND transporter periplasmic adaptor subunit [Mobilitalea sp.]
MSRLKTFCMIGAVVCFFTGCGLLPEEEELRTAPIVSAYEAEEYNYILVERGDIISDEDMLCIYQPTKEEKLSFPIAGEYYGNVYVKAGDEVKKGDLLAELQMEQVLLSIEDSKLAVTKLELQIKHIDNQMSLERERLTITKDNNTNSLENYEAQKSQVIDSLYIAKKRLEEKEELKRVRQIYAGMDGIISYVKVTRSRDTSVEGEEFITIMDSSLSFTAKSKNGKYLTLGDKVDIVVGEETYTTEIKSIEDDPSGVQIIKFALTEPTTNLPQGARGVYKLILEEKKDVLYITASAVIIAGDKSIVYGVDEDGLKTIKAIETGMNADNKIEILSGLEEGERVILD